VTLTANNGTNGVNYWTATSGTHSVQAWVDDVNRIAESNKNNNTLVVPFTVCGASLSSTTWYSVVDKNSSKCVDASGAGTANGTAVQQSTCNSSFEQQYQFQATDSCYYRVNNRNNSAQVWDVSGISTADGALIHLWSYVGGLNQQWMPVSEGNGYYHFVARHDGKCLDVPNASTADGVQLQQYTCNGSGAQSYSLVAH
jgi:hypothetical protein